MEPFQSSKAFIAVALVLIYHVMGNFCGVKYLRFSRICLGPWKFYPTKFSLVDLPTHGSSATAKVLPCENLHWANPRKFYPTNKFPSIRYGEAVAKILIWYRRPFWTLPHSYIESTAVLSDNWTEERGRSSKFYVGYSCSAWVISVLFGIDSLQTYYTIIHSGAFLSYMYLYALPLLCDHLCATDYGCFM